MPNAEEPSGPQLRRRVFAAVTVAATLVLGIGLAEGGLRARLELVGFERLAYLPEPLKLALGPRFVRAYRTTGQAYFAAHARQPNLMNTVPDPRYGLRLAAPGAPQPATADRPFPIDEFGFRNPHVPERADVLFIGDSFTAGVSGATVWPGDELFATQVGRALGCVTYQAACYGWGPRQYHVAVGDVVERLRPRWVVIATYADNDFGDVQVYDAWQASPFETYAEFRMYRELQLRNNPRRDGLSVHSVLWNLFRFRFFTDAPQPVRKDVPVPPRMEHYRTTPLVPMEEVPRDRSPRFPPMELLAVEPGVRLQIEMTTSAGAHTVDLRWRAEDVRAPARLLMQLAWWPPYADALDHAAAAAQAAGARPLIVLIPTVERVVAPAVAAAGLDTAWPYRANVVPDGTARAVASLVAARDADFLDLAPALREALASGVFAYAPGDIHFNAAGHTIAAEQIAAYIQRADRIAEDAATSPTPTRPK